MQGRPRHRRRQIQPLLDDPEVAFLVLLESTDDTGQRLLTVGPNLEFSSLNAVVQNDFEGFEAVAFVDCRKKALVAATRSPLTRLPWAQAQPDAEELEDTPLIGVPELETEEEAPTEKFDISALEKREQELKRLAETLKKQDEELAKMEEDMIMRMNQHVMKEAELEQWEENLFERERLLHDAIEANQLADTKIAKTV